MPADVHEELVRGFAAGPLAVYSPVLADFRKINMDERECRLDLVAFSETVLGRNSPERIALLTRARAIGRPHPNASIRAVCRDHAGWSRGRSSFYRMANRGARLVAGMLNDKHILAPETPPKPRRWRKYRNGEPQLF
jgi:hypothetical protein